MLSMRQLEKLKNKGTTQGKEAPLGESKYSAIAVDVESATSPVKEPTGRRVRIGAAAAVDSSPDGNAQSRRCPTYEELVQAALDAFARMLESLMNMREMLLEVWDNGGAQLLLGLVLLYALYEFMVFLWAYLRTELNLNLELPRLPSIADAYFRFAEASPMLALTANFACFGAVGAAFFFINEITDTLREWGMVLRRFAANPCEACSVGGYKQLDDTAALAGLLANALPPIDVAAAAAEASAAQGDQRGGGAKRGDLEDGTATPVSTGASGTSPIFCTPSLWYPCCTPTCTTTPPSAA